MLTQTKGIIAIALISLTGCSAGEIFGAYNLPEGSLEPTDITPTLVDQTTGPTRPPAPLTAAEQAIIQADLDTLE